MTLNFPNQSRSYDATLRAVRFWGYDGAMEASFYVNEDALKRIQPGLRSDEAGILAAFDSHQRRQEFLPRRVAIPVEFVSVRLHSRKMRPPLRRRAPKTARHAAPHHRIDFG